MSYSNYAPPAYQAALDDRLAFIRRTYAILGASLVAFAALATLFVFMGVGALMLSMMGGRWLLVIGGMMLVAVVASMLASPERSVGAQFAGLGIYVVGEALVFSSSLLHQVMPVRRGTRYTLLSFLFGET